MHIVIHGPFGIRNKMFDKNNMFHTPALKLSKVFTLDEGMFNLIIVQQLHEKLKENFVSTINIS